MGPHSPTDPLRALIEVVLLQDDGVVRDCGILKGQRRQMPVRAALIIVLHGREARRMLEIS